MTNLLRNNLHETPWAVNVADSSVGHNFDHVDHRNNKGQHHDEVIDEDGNLYELDFNFSPSSSTRPKAHFTIKFQ